jgi:hypothetical protein
MARTSAPPKRKTTRPARPRRQRRCPSSDPNDGGAWSLAGYIYQLLGSGAERVKLDDVPSAAAGDTSLRFFLEQHGQDATVDDGGTVRLVQFKYSQGGRPIQQKELAEILLALKKSSKQVARSAVVRWQLVTNRPLSATAKKLHDAARRVKRRRTSRGAGTGTDYLAISRLGAQLEVVEKDLDQFKTSLQDAAKRFGVDDEGVASRVMALLLDVAARPLSHREVLLEALNGALAGYPKPKSIRLRDCQGDMRSALESAVQAKGGIVLREAVERRALQSLLAQRAALAIVYGPGGCGKTLSLFRALDQRLSDAIGPAGMIVESPRSLGHIVGTWRNAPSPTGSPTEVLRQLRMANPDVGPPVLVLGFDGLDEVPDSERVEAEELIRHFHRMHVELHRSQVEPDGFLVVTCRNKEDLDDVVAPQGTGGPIQPEVPSFKIDEFSDEEFAAVWALWFRDEPVPRLGLPDEMLATVADTFAGAAAADPRLLALRHPAMLGCTKLLSAAQRQQLYQGDAALWREVLKRYFTWFTKKASRRARCSVDKAREVLKAVARGTAGKSGACDRDDDWVTPATAHTGYTPHLVSRIFDDAVTAGVVEIDGRSRYTLQAGTPIQWRWRFPELAAHLASLA